jgi:hypothetical protein
MARVQKTKLNPDSILKLSVAFALILFSVTGGYALLRNSDAAARKVASITYIGNGSYEVTTLTKRAEREKSNLWVAHRCYGPDGQITAQYHGVQWNDYSQPTGIAYGFNMVNEYCEAYAWMHPRAMDPVSDVIVVTKDSY